ncbi:MAG: Gmad2 immunoglobulin-like domain-containing protein [Patescibacteria group bacterium]|jgi:hypothetical protein
MKKCLFLLLGLTFLGAGCSFFSTQDDPNTEEPESNIVLESPADGSIVTSPLTLSGRARVFENVVSWSILDHSGVSVLEGNVIANAPDTGEFGDFEARIFLPVLEDENFTLEVFTYSAMDGSQQDVVTRSLKLDSLEKTSVDVYFMDAAAAEYGDCSAVDFEKRTMAYTTNVAELALSELLSGPTSEWATTVVPNFTTIKSVSVKNGVATVEFESPDINEWSGGSCRVTAMRAQIEKTLMQFDTVDSVVVSVNGEEETIFQP